MKKYIIIASILLCCNITSFTRDEIDCNVLQNGLYHDVSETILTSDSPITFSTYIPIHGGSWKIKALDTNGIWIDISYAAFETNDNCLVFYPSKVDWKLCKHEYCTEINRDYFYCKAIVKTDYSADELYFNLAILPGKPILEDISLNAIYNWSPPDPYYPDESTLEFKTKYDNTDRLYIRFAYKAWPNAYHSSEKPTYFQYIHEIRDVSNDRTGIALFSFDDIDWGECFNVLAANKYGTASSDTLNTSDYVTDPDLIKYITDYWEQQSNIVEFESSENNIIIDDNMIYCPQNIEELTIYTHSGLTICHHLNPETIDLSHLIKGVYVITYRTSSNLTKTLKYLKL